MAKKPKTEPLPENALARLLSNWKTVTIYQAMIAVVSAMSFLTPAYLFVKPIALAQAGQAIRNVMIQEGIDPEKIKKLPDQVDTALQAQNRIESDLATVKAQQKQLIEILQQTIRPPPQ